MVKEGHHTYLGQLVKGVGSEEERSRSTVSADASMKPIINDYIQDRYLTQLKNMGKTTKNLIAAANVGVFSLSFAAMFTNNSSFNVITRYVNLPVASDVFYSIVLYITAMMARVGEYYGKYISSGLLVLFGFVMVRRSNAFKLIQQNGEINYWYLGAGGFAFLYAYRQAMMDDRELTDGTLANRVLNVSSNFNSLVVLGLIFMGTKNYSFSSLSGKGSPFYGASNAFRIS